MTFKTSELDDLRATYEKARNLAQSAAEAHAHAGEKQEAATQLRRVLRCQAAMDTLANARERIKVLENPKPRKTFTDGGEPDLVPTTEQSRRVGAIAHRRKGSAWTAREVSAYKKLGKIAEEDLAAMERYYADNWPPESEKNILRHDLQTLLNNWPGELERATRWKPKVNARAAFEDPKWIGWLALLGHPYTPFRTAMDWMKTDFRKWVKEQGA